MDSKDFSLEAALAAVEQKTGSVAFPSEITVFCDFCGIEHSGDYIVTEADNSETRFGFARAHLKTLGWVYKDGLDLCPECQDSK